MAYRCRECRQHFSVRTGTVLAESRLPLQKWLMAIYMMTTARKGIPSTQMARELGITQKSAWFLAQRIRETWMASFGGDMGNIVEIDETYIGGKEKNKHAKDKLRSGRGAVGKKAVVGILERNGRVAAMPIDSTDRETLHDVINAAVKKGLQFIPTNGAHITAWKATIITSFATAWANMSAIRRIQMALKVSGRC
jgi:hypothetical protein